MGFPQQVEVQKGIVVVGRAPRSPLLVHVNVKGILTANIHTRYRNVPLSTILPSHIDGKIVVGGKINRNTGRKVRRTMDPIHDNRNRLVGISPDSVPIHVPKMNRHILIRYEPMFVHRLINRGLESRNGDEQCPKQSVEDTLVRGERVGLQGIDILTGTRTLYLCKDYYVLGLDVQFSTQIFHTVTRVAIQFPKKSPQKGWHSPVHTPRRRNKKFFEWLRS